MKTVSRPPISEALLKLARQIDARVAPEYVAVEPTAGCLPHRSYENVCAVVKRHGGSMQAGWCLREQRNAFAEGAFHAVWRSPSGTLIDITPRDDKQSQILFLSDLEIRWEGETIEPRRMMLHMQACYCGSGLPFKVCHGQADE
jgi:hypothetical protein